MPRRPAAPERPELGRYLEELRLAHGFGAVYTPAKLAGISRQYWSQLEHGWTWRYDAANPQGGRWAPVQRPREPTLRAIADVLGASQVERRRLYDLAGLPQRRSGPRTPRPMASDGTPAALDEGTVRKLIEELGDRVVEALGRRGREHDGGEHEPGGSEEAGPAGGP